MHTFFSNARRPPEGTRRNVRNPQPATAPPPLPRRKDGQRNRPSRRGAYDKRQVIEEPCELETLTHGSEAEPGRRRFGSGQQPLYPFGRMTSALTKPVSTPFCRRDTIVEQDSPEH